MLDKILQFIAEKLRCLPVSNGGTGAVDVSQARINLGIGNVNNTSDENKNVNSSKYLRDVNTDEKITADFYNGRMTDPTYIGVWKTGGILGSMTFDAVKENLGIISKADILDMTHPVGSYYWSSKPTDPHLLFGGTWKQIEDKFVLATGKRIVDTTGGEEMHTLTYGEMPSHSHTVTGSTTSNGYHSHEITGFSGGATGTASCYTKVSKKKEGAKSTVSSGEHTHTINGTATAVGGGEAHNNMPPYVVAFCWKRIA